MNLAHTQKKVGGGGGGTVAHSVFSNIFAHHRILLGTFVWSFHRVTFVGHYCVNRDEKIRSDDFLFQQKPKQSSNRRRTDPVVTMSSMFELILNEMRQLPSVS